MFYAIVSGGVVALSLTIWALIERSRATAAQSRYEKRDAECKGLRKDLNALTERMKGVADERDRCKNQLTVLESRIASQRARLLKCTDPASIQAAFDELQGEPWP